MRTPGLAAPWLGPERDAWLDEVRSWLRDGFAVERLEVVKERPWSSVLRGAIGGRAVYFKASCRSGRHEPALVEALARDFPDLLPQLPLELLDDDEALPHELPDSLSPAERQALVELGPALEEQCRWLGALPGAGALEHGDLHDGNVLVRGTELRLFDWGDATLCHPFASSLTLRARVAARDPGRDECLRDAYLEPWTAFASRAELSLRYERALWLAHLGRALNWRRILSGAGELPEWRPEPANWLRRWLAEPQP